ncbi:hypothetical protein LJR225_005080 [Phenylobacterium sp. LjRoot225]|uniref:hypothetical protein n=1 Tax=Phenylobacterium sp. LjRoot225 TaxID=3342285 RepID=UPI003ECCD73F
MSDRPTSTSQLSDLAREVYGSEWAAQLGRFTGTNPRTCQRIRQADAEGREYPGAKGVLAAFAEALGIAAERAKEAVERGEVSP